MVNYSNGKIYRIVNIENETIYIGSTTTSLSKRLASHEHRGNGNKIVLVKECPCENNEQLRREEQKCIEEHEGLLLNERRAYQTEEQLKEQDRELQRKWYEANREKHSEFCRKWREANREKCNEHKRKWREANREKHNEYSRKWHEANREKHNEQKCKYREANREQILSKAREKITCPHCGGEVRKDGLLKHQRSKKCMKARESKLNPNLDA
jgi:hypothetical protein